MFTGIVQALGTILSISSSGKGAEISIESSDLDFSDVAVGDSIACNGVCLTVTGISGNSFVADISHETMERTIFKYLSSGSKINLEKALTPNTHLGGHIVQGHVDGIGRITKISRTDNAVDIWVDSPADISKYIAIKGSITINGISLTVNELKGDAFRLTLIPHTHDITNAMMWKEGDLVNVEVDVLARYIERLLSHQEQNTKKSSMTASFLMENGFM